MSFLKKVQKTRTVVAKDGPEGGLPSGAAHPQNWAQSGKNEHELRADANKLHDMVAKWQEDAIQGHHIFENFMKSGGINFEKYSPILLKGLSREKLQMVCTICEKLLNEAHAS